MKEDREGGSRRGKENHDSYTSHLSGVCEMRSQDLTFSPSFPAVFQLPGFASKPSFLSYFYTSDNSARAFVRGLNKRFMLYSVSIQLVLCEIL